MTGLKFLAVTPFFSTGFIVAIGGESEYIQFGALGLCALVVVFLCRYLSELTETHRKERKELIDAIKSRESEFIIIIKENIKADNRLAEVLEDRPCLIGDQRIKHGEPR